MKNALFAASSSYNLLGVYPILKLFNRVHFYEEKPYVPDKQGEVIHEADVVTTCTPFHLILHQNQKPTCSTKRREKRLWHR